MFTVISYSLARIWYENGVGLVIPERGNHDSKKSTDHGHNTNLSGIGLSSRFNRSKACPPDYELQLAAVEEMSVDHGRFHVFMAEHFLDDANIVVRFK